MLGCIYPGFHYEAFSLGSTQLALWYLVFLFFILKVITRGYNQSQPRCIPDKVFKLMLSCLEQRAEKRPTIQELQKQLAPILECE